MAHHPLPPPLSPAQRDLAARYWPLAGAIAARLAARLRWHDPETLHDATQFGLVEAASRWDPRGPVGFAEYARHRIRGAAIDTIRAEVLHGRRFVPAGDSAWEWAAPPGRQAGAGEDLVGPLLRDLPDRHAAVMRRVYLHGDTHREAARHAGLSRSRVGHICRESLAMLRGSLTKETACPCP